MHNVIDQAMIGLIATLNAIARMAIFQQPLNVAASQSFSLAAIQLVIDVVANAVAMYYESWAGVPVVEVWARRRWPHMLTTAAIFLFA